MMSDATEKGTQRKDTFNLSGNFWINDTSQQNIISVSLFVDIFLCENFTCYTFN